MLAFTKHKHLGNKHECNLSCIEIQSRLLYSKYTTFSINLWSFSRSVTFIYLWVSFYIILNPSRQHLSLEIYRRKSDFVECWKLEKCWCYYKKILILIDRFEILKVFILKLAINYKIVLIVYLTYKFKHKQ